MHMNRWEGVGIEGPGETGFILRCAGKAGNPFQTTQGNSSHNFRLETRILAASQRDREVGAGLGEAVGQLTGNPICGWHWYLG